jgi:hypothetical protein
MAEATFEYELGEHVDRTFLLIARSVPGFDDPAEFAVVVHYNDPEADQVEQVALIDTAHGGGSISTGSAGATNRKTISTSTFGGGRTP